MEYSLKGFVKYMFVMNHIIIFNIDILLFDGRRRLTQNMIVVESVESVESVAESAHSGFFTKLCQLLLQSLKVLILS